MRLLAAVVCSGALLGYAAPQRAQHQSHAPPQQSALISECVAFYDTVDRTLEVFRTVQDCARRVDPGVWRQVIPVAEPLCFAENATGDSVSGRARLTCSENSGDSSYLPPCVTTHDGVPIPPGHIYSAIESSARVGHRRAALTWHMSFFSGVHCDLDAPSLVMRGRLNECDVCEVDASGGGSSHRHAQAFHSLVADGIAPGVMTVVQEGSPVHEAARRQAAGQGSAPGGGGGGLVLTPSRWPVLVTVVVLSVLVTLVVVAVAQIVLWCSRESGPCCFSRCCSRDRCRRPTAPSAKSEPTSRWHRVAHADSIGDSSIVGLVSAEKLELDDIM